MAGTLLVSNVHFDSAGSRRIDYVNNDGVIRITSNAIKVPTGNTSSRPTSEEGLIRYNNEIGTFEGSNATSWGAIGGDISPVFDTANAAFNKANIAYSSSNTAVVTQINAATNTAFSDSDMLTARKDSDGSLIKWSWVNVKYMLKTYFDTLYATLAAATTTAAGIVELATAAEWRTGTANNRALVVSETWSSAGEVTLTDAATITVNGATFINAVVTLRGNRTLGTWSNPKVGQSGYIRVVQDGVGSRTLAYHADYEFENGFTPALSKTANSQDMLFYQVIASGRVLLSIVKAIS